MRSSFLILLFLCTLKAYSFNWLDLWLTKDQQGQSLMHKGKFKKAEQTFRQENWQAAASYKAGSYENAADLYKNLQGENNFYNLGNTLAHLGRYKEAIEAYDKAIKLNSANQDAIFNRKLVEDLLKKEQKNEKQKNKDKDKDQDKNKDQNSQQNQDKSGQDKKGQDQQNKSQEEGQPDNSQGQAKPKENLDDKAKDQQDKNQKDQHQENKAKQNKEEQTKDSDNKTKPAEEKQNKTEQAEKKASKNMNQSAEEKEKQQAKEQWLRLIPDDPGGLMREKFLRDHLRRQSEWFE